ncbi:oxidoreductase [Ferrimicrobium acidiphilum]|uniref:Putative oxidoreductase YdbC n=1 Tax=Ferrimicrobium acidiphilum DSM 19497 TaxID=1121877 RepID=A0A0D8FUD7_9ACTN|nr:oxidoreductase [Ferrimicrobium acidiphilum]KJE76890.1 putative oxidoreductase YdbC [Ferrimicrobium acidiphilum DSM 19497]
MNTFPLGPVDVNRIGFGAMQLPGPGVFGPPRNHEEAIAVLRRAVELGANHIDTAQFYGPEVANELIREALHPYPDDLLLVSKVGATRDDKGAWLPASRPEQLRSAVEDNLRTLHVDQLGVVNLRLHAEHDSAPDQRVSLEDQLSEMVSLRNEGKVANIGISTANVAQVEVAITQAGVVCVQNAFSLVDQSDIATLELCRQHNIAYVPYFPLGSAFPGMPKVTANTTVQTVAARMGATPAQVGLAWLLNQSEIILLIPGTSSLAHLEENMNVADLVLSPEDIADLERAV